MVSIKELSKEGLDDKIIFERINDNIVRIQLTVKTKSKTFKNINGNFILTNTELDVKKETLENLEKWMTKNNIKFKENFKYDTWMYLKSCDN